MARGRSTKRLIFVIGILNATDALLTWILLKNSWAFEANPLMAALIDKGPVPFFLVKVGVGSGVLAYFAWRIPIHKAAKFFWVTMGIIMIYGTINVLHILSYAFGPYMG